MPTKKQAGKSKAKNDKAQSQASMSNGAEPVASLRATTELPEAVATFPLAPAKNRWLWRSIGAAAVLIGWLFISWSNRYRFTAPVVMLALGWLAVVASIYFLARLGAAAASEADPKDVWWKPMGKLEELEHQKRALFKAIKEVEFDQQMGKQSEADARAMISVYRAAAIEVIKAIESDGKVVAGLTARQQIEQEVRARLQLAGQSKRNAGKVRHAKDQQSSAMTPEVMVEDESKVDEPLDGQAVELARVHSDNSAKVEAPDGADAVVADRGAP
jgi:hypothetical protein